MALFMPGKSKCVICEGVIAEGDGVCFEWFESADQQLQPLSDASCHYLCIANHPRQGEIAEVYLGQLGDDGVRPNGTRVVTARSNIRIAFGPITGVRLSQTPVFVTLEMPEMTGHSWLDSRFWEACSQAAGAQFQGAGFSIRVERPGQECLVSIEMCPHGYVPDQCSDRGLVRKVVRRIPSNVAEAFAQDCRESLDIMRRMSWGSGRQ